jgi:hypothetical protein
MNWKLVFYIIHFLVFNFYFATFIFSESRPQPFARTLKARRAVRPG